MLKMQKSQSGFTMVEIIMVVMILAISAAIVVPQMADGDEFRLNGASSDVNVVLMYAQTQSITTGKTHRIVFDVDNQSIELQMQNDDLTYGTVLHPLTKAQYRISFGSGSSYETVKIDEVNFDGGNNLLFDAMARPYSESGVDLSTGSFKLVSRAHSKTITVSPVTGKITFQ